MVFVYFLLETFQKGKSDSEHVGGQTATSEFQDSSAVRPCENLRFNLPGKTFIYVVLKVLMMLDRAQKNFTITSPVRHEWLF